MMTLLVFLSLIFSLLGIVVTHYINTYKEAYELWTKCCVYNASSCSIANGSNKLKVVSICSKIESLSRQVCEINDLLGIVIRTLQVTIAIIFLVFAFNIGLNYTKDGIGIDVILNIASVLLATFVYFAVKFITRALKIGKEHKADSIQRKLFEVWWNLKCHREKCAKYKDKSKPNALYKTLLEEVTTGKINKAELTSDEMELIEKLKSRDFKADIPRWLQP
jgi:hypothetical protein